jgi:hypothetical protein
MKTPTRPVLALLFAVATAIAIEAQNPNAAITTNPIPTTIVKRGLAVEIEELTRLPDTRGVRPLDQDVSPAGWARVSYVRDLPDGRRFVNDSRGFLYLLGPDNQPQLYANVAAAFPLAVYNRLESGFIGFAFHPEFAKNGLFYTVHAERAAGNPKTPDFIPPGFAAKDVTYHNIITEWHATNPPASTFDGTRRELLREAHVVNNLTHPMGAVEFNPSAKPGDADYGLLYTSGSDHGFSNGGGPNANTASQTQRLDSIMTAILRFDPRSAKVTGGTKGLGDYTIPMTNVFASDGDPKTLGEVYAYGFRNAHRLSWDTDGTMFASDIGMNHIEEINIVRNGGNYGWMRREGIWENGRWRGGVLNELFTLPPDVLSGREKDGFHLPGRDVRPRRRPRGERRLRLPRTDPRPPRQVRLRRRPEWTPVRVRPGRAEEGRRWHPGDGRGRGGSSARRSGRSRPADRRVDARAGRSSDGRDRLESRSAHQPDEGWRAPADVPAGWDDPDAGTGLDGENGLGATLAFGVPRADRRCARPLRA